ncbi:hypothetical protein [Streptomyces longispororuber]|uniref:hypothetical protein n=1 Tax=Streptomyces longispororuber TaxID=68230 RepID=UPI0036F5FC99
MPVCRGFTRAVLLTAALIASTAGTATADTSKSEQTSTLGGALAPVLSPATGPSDNRQANSQLMDKAHTTNWALLDYVGVKDNPEVLKDPGSNGAQAGQPPGE